VEDVPVGDARGLGSSSSERFVPEPRHNPVMRVVAATIR